MVLLNHLILLDVKEKLNYMVKILIEPLQTDAAVLNLGTIDYGNTKQNNYHVKI